MWLLPHHVWQPKSTLNLCRKAKQWIKQALLQNIARLPNKYKSPVHFPPLFPIHINLAKQFQLVLLINQSLDYLKALMEEEYEKEKEMEAKEEIK